jgi:hypothetical protein
MRSDFQRLYFATEILFRADMTDFFADLSGFGQPMECQVGHALGGVAGYWARPGRS